MSGGFRPPDPGRYIGNSFTGARFPSWGDPEGNFGKLTVLQLRTTDSRQLLPKNPFVIRNSVDGFINGGIEGGYPEKDGKSYVLKLRNPTHIEALKKMTQLLDNTPVTIDDHPTLNVSRCSIFCKETVTCKTEDLLKELKGQGVMDVRRVTKRGEGDQRTNTGTLFLTVKGTTFPEFVSIGFNRCPTRTYYPAPLLCFGCYAFGHTKKNCDVNKHRCGHCSEQHPTSPDTRCNKSAFCNRCKSTEHPLSSRKCPEYLREDDIQHIRVDRGVSYPVAKRIFEEQNNISNTPTAAAVVNDSMEARVSSLEKSRDEAIQKLEAALKLADDRQSRYNKVVEVYKAQRTELEQLRLDLEMKNTRIAELETELLEYQDAVSRQRETQFERWNEKLTEFTEGKRSSLPTPIGSPILPPFNHGNPQSSKPIPIPHSSPTTQLLQIPKNTPTTTTSSTHSPRTQHDDQGKRSRNNSPADNQPPSKLSARTLRSNSKK